MRRKENAIDLAGSIALKDWSLTPDAPLRFGARLHRTPLQGLRAPLGLPAAVGGTATAHLDLEGTTLRLAGTGEVQVEQAEVGGEPIDSFFAHIRVVESLWYLDDLQIGKGQGRIVGWARIDPSTHGISAELHGANFALAEFKRLALSPGSYASIHLEGLAGFDLRAEGLPASMRLSAAWAVRSMKGGPVGDARGKLEWQGQRVHLAGEAKGPGGQWQFAGQVERQGAWPLALSGRYTELRLEPWIRPLLGQKSMATAIASGVLSIHGPLKDLGLLEARGQMQTLEVNFPDLSWKNQRPIDIRYADRTLTAQRFRMLGPATDFEVEGSMRLGEPAELSLTVEGNAEATLLSLIDPALRATGRSELKLRISGSLAQPRLNGTLSVRDVTLGLGELPFRLTRLRGEITLDGDRATLRSLRGVSGGGSVTLSGFTTLAGIPRSDLRAELERVRVRYPKDFTSLLDGGLRLTGTSEQAQLSGELTVRQLVANESMNLLARMAQAGGPNRDKLAGIASPFASKIRLDVRGSSAPSVRLETRDLRATLDIDMRLQGTLASPVEVGTVRIVSGEAVFRGNRYRLTRGDISMSNPLRTQRVLDLEAQTRIQRHDLTLNIAGPLERLKIAYRSDPPLSTAEFSPSWHSAMRRRKRCPPLPLSLSAL